MYRRRKNKPFVIICALISGIALVGVILVLLCLVFVSKNIDYSFDEALFLSAGKFESTTFFANSSSDKGEYLPVKIEAAGSLRKTYSPIEDMPRMLIDGFIAVEDRGFAEHSGVDFKRTALAALNYLVGKEKRFGASTITQQVIKNISGDNEISVKRKLSEILRARHIEKVFSKEEIMELYLNIIPMSENIYGVCEAAEKYFGKSPSELSVSEAATLIGITNAPTAYSPYLNPEKCIEKRNSILKIMLSEGVIDEEECENAITEPLVVIPKEKMPDRYDSWFVESVIESVTEDLTKKYDLSYNGARLMLLGGGYKVYTTMNRDAQRILEEVFENEQLFERAELHSVNYSAVILDSTNADTVAIVGNRGKKRANRLLNHAELPHIPASALKPLSVYAPLLDKRLINWATVIEDQPLRFFEENGQTRPYPRNSPDVYDGPITVKDALRLSKNTVAMRLLSKLGKRESFAFLRDTLGIDTLVEGETREGKVFSDLSDAPLALGQLTKGISLRKLCECYTVFPSDGRLYNSRNYIKVTDVAGNTVLERKKEAKQVIDKKTARIMNMLLTTVTDDGTARGITLGETVDTAGKTGTASGAREKVFVGYTPYYTAGVYTGSEKGESVAGLSPTAINLWNEVMTRLHKTVTDKDSDLKIFNTEGLLYLPYCKASGKIPTDECYSTEGYGIEYGFFTEDNKPMEECSEHLDSHPDPYFHYVMPEEVFLSDNDKKRSGMREMGT